MFHYGLRINHHAGDHGRLISEALGPALYRLRHREPSTRCFYKPHWSGGPHIVVALDGVDEGPSDSLWNTLQEEIESWFAKNPNRPAFDAAHHARLSIELARSEGVELGDEPLHENYTTERGNFSPPSPLGKPKLSIIRNEFKAGSLDVTLNLLNARLSSPPAALVEYVRLLVCLHQVKWVLNAKFWPLSPRGQSVIISGLSAQAMASFPEMVERLRPSLIDSIERESLLSDKASPAAPTQNWIALLQNTYDALVSLVQEDPEGMLGDQGKDPVHAREFSARLPGLSPGRVQEILASPVHFPYRVLMNFLYDMMPAVGFSASRRLFCCHLLTATLESHYPEIMAGAFEAGELA